MKQALLLSGEQRKLIVNSDGGSVVFAEFSHTATTETNPGSVGERL